MKKTKLKLKKSVWVGIIIFIFLSLGLYAGINIYQDIQYKKTDEYQLLQIGYTKDEINILEKNFKNGIKELLNKEKDEFLLSLFQEKYYLSNNLSRYRAFYEIHPDYSASKIITYVNTNNDYDYYEHDINTDLTQDYLILVNKYYHLPSDYEPDDLVKVNNKYYYGENHQIRQVTYDAFKNMWEAAYNEDIYLIINSSYRTFDEQKSVYDDYKDSKGTTYADSIAARPGYSEHQTGLSLDIFSKTHTTTSNFKDSPAYIWLQNNAYKYGFIERYTEEAEEITGFSAESWHWRYVGIEAATYIHENNITFDEYYAYFIAK